MPKVSALQNNFSAGEFSPLTQGRVDSDRYRQGLETCLNYMPVLQGGTTRRPGTTFVAEVKTSSKSTRLVPFEFSVTQAYILEFGDLYIRFYKDHGQIISGTPVEISTPYVEADLFELKFTQSADVLYITHPDYEPRKVTRTSHTSWSISIIDFKDGPYLAQNTTSVTLFPSATTGVGITITASAATFVSTDVGRIIRIKHNTTWGYAKVTAFTDSTHVTATVVNAFDNASASPFWRLGLWGTQNGYPSCVSFHEDRLFFAGTKGYPSRVDGSNSGDYENFAPSNTDTNIVASNAVSFSLNANDVNVSRWVTSDEKGLLIGTVGGEWVLRPSSQNEALSATNVTAKRATSFGSADVQPVQIGKATLFLQRAGRKIREMTYFFDVDGFRATDITKIAEHVTASGIKQLAYQKEPQPTLWCVRNDGVLAAMIYERDVDNLQAGWYRNILGGTSDAAGNDAVVESVATIPSPDGTRDEVWVIVKRYINGSTKRYVEYLNKTFEDTDNPQDGIFVDCSLTYDSPKTISGATKANPVVITATAHGFSNGDKILINEVSGMEELNGNTYLVANKTANTFELTNLSGSNINGTGFNTYVSGGEVRKLVSTISGLSHLEGESVSILADGAVQPNATVSSGAISLATPAAVVHIGYGYNSDIKLLRIEAGAADGTALGKTRRIHRVGFLLHRSLGLKIGTSFDDLTTLTFRTSSDPLTRAPALFSGIISETLGANYDFENQICIRQDQPLPSTILAVMPMMVTQDRG